MKNERVTLTEDQFDRYEPHYPSNMVIVQMPPEYKITTPSGIDVGFNPDVMYGEGDLLEKKRHYANILFRGNSLL
jgi:hypothetical protein